MVETAPLDSTGQGWTTREARTGGRGKLDAAEQGVEADKAKHIGALQLNPGVRPT
jgi:hypothetical protein